MNKNQLKGQFKETKGKMKEEVGHAMGNTSLESEGIIDQVKGKLEKKIGDTKASVKKVVDSLLGHPKT